jgi:hypothetical protein
VRCGIWVYRLAPSQVTAGDAARFLAGVDRRFDVVSCFSLLHHAVRDGQEGPARLIRQLDAVTGKVLFLDCGEEHEEWLRGLLPGWNRMSIAAWLRAHTSFSRVLPLGTDEDRGQRNGDNYGRTLFACVR